MAPTRRYGAGSRYGTIAASNRSTSARSMYSYASGNVEADHLLPRERVAELFAHATHVPLLHRHRQVGPAQVPGGHADAGARLGARGAHLVPVRVREQVLGGQGAQPVAGADEEDLHARGGSGARRRSPAAAARSRVHSSRSIANQQASYSSLNSRGGLAA